jgi:predicted nucleotidyltransferase
MKDKLNSLVNVRGNLHNEESRCYPAREKVFRELTNIIHQEKNSCNVYYLLHGSYATGNITSFSDVDVVCISNTNVLTVADMIRLKKTNRAIEKYIFKIDPLMHHGIDLIEFNSFLSYDESVLPIDTLNKAVLLNAESLYIPAIIDTSLSRKNAKTKLKNKCNIINNFESSFINRSPYKLKCLLSVLFLIPVLLMQSETGVFSYKRDSIGSARRLFGGSLPFDIIDDATKLRENWIISERISAMHGFLSAMFNRTDANLINANRLCSLLTPLSAEFTEELLIKSKQFSRAVQQVISDRSY